MNTQSNPTLGAGDLKTGGFYNWKNQPELLVYMGLSGPAPVRRWHQFALVKEPGVCWCEVLPEDLHLLEETGAAS